MWYRRLVHDDSRGVAEALNETVCAFDKCAGLTVSPYRMSLFVRHFPYSDISFTGPRKVFPKN